MAVETGEGQERGRLCSCPKTNEEQSEMAEQKRLLQMLKGKTIKEVTPIEGEGENEGVFVGVLLETTDGTQIEISAEHGIEVERYD